MVSHEEEEENRDSEWTAFLKACEAPDGAFDPVTVAYVKRMAQREKETAARREKEAFAAGTPKDDASVRENARSGASAVSSGSADFSASAAGSVRPRHSDAEKSPTQRVPMTAAEKEQLEMVKKLLCSNIKGYFKIAEWMAKLFSPADSERWLRNRMKKHIIESFDEEKADQVRTFLGGLPIDDGGPGAYESTPARHGHGTPPWLDKFVNTREWREVVYTLQKTKATRLLAQVVEMISDRGFDREVQTAEGAATTTYIVFCRSVKAFFHDHFAQLVERQYQSEGIQAQLTKFHKEWTLPYTFALVKSLSRTQRADDTEFHVPELNDVDPPRVDSGSKSWINDMGDELVKNGKGALLKLWFSCLGCYPDVFTLVSRWIEADGNLVIKDPDDLTKLLEAVNKGHDKDDKGVSGPAQSGSAQPNKTSDNDMQSKVDSFHMPAVSATGESTHGTDSKRQVEGLGEALSSGMVLRALASCYVHLDLTLDQRRAGTCLYDRLGVSSDMETVYSIVHNSALSFAQKCKKLRKNNGQGAALASILWLTHIVQRSPFSLWCTDAGKSLTSLLYCVIRHFSTQQDIVHEVLIFLRIVLQSLLEMEDKGSFGPCVYSNAQSICSLYPQLGTLLAIILLETKQLSVMHFVLEMNSSVDPVLLRTFVSVVFRSICPPYSQSFSSLWARFLNSPKVAEALSSDARLRKLAKEHAEAEESDEPPDEESQDSAPSSQYQKSDEDEPPPKVRRLECI